jgi:large subunit ribosomal protein L10
MARAGVAAIESVRPGLGRGFVFVGGNGRQERNMPSQKNLDAVERLKETLERSPVVIGTDYGGLNVAVMTELRRGLRQRGLEYRVVKNTLAGVAAEEIGRPQIKEVLRGATGLVLSDGDPTEAARALADFLRTSRIVLPVLGAVVEGQVVSAEDVGTLAALPPKPVLMAQLLGQLSGVMGRMVVVLNGPARGLATVLGGPSRALATVLQRSTEGSE